MGNGVLYLTAPNSESKHLAHFNGVVSLTATTYCLYEIQASNPNSIEIRLRIDPLINVLFTRRLILWNETLFAVTYRPALSHRLFTLLTVHSCASCQHSAR